MCGIAGARDDWLRSRSLAPEAALREALRRMAWRGPDEVSVARVGAHWIGCARLAISRRDSGQPAVRRGGAAGSVLNGALTSARELWARLRPGLERRRRLPNDAWIPLVALAEGFRWESSGHYASAVVEARSDAPHLRRDPFGEKPLFVHERDGKVVAFASTLPALRALGASPEVGDLPETAILEFFRLGFSRYPREAPTDPWPEPATGRALRPLLSDAVRRCLDVGVGAALALSGGIDSACLAAACAEIGARVPCYQFRSAPSPAVERATARSIARHLGLELREVDGGPEILEDLAFLTRCHGLPLGDPSVLAAHALCRAVAADGARVLLSGEGADELLLGYRRHRALGWMPRIPLPIAPLARNGTGYGARLVRAIGSPDPHAELLDATPPGVLARLLADDLLLRAEGRGRAARDLDSVRKRELEIYLRRDLLPKLDVASLAAGVEARCPYLDRSVAAWALGRPARELLGKKPLWSEFASALPPAVFRMSKKGFGLPLDRWFRGETPLLDLLADERTRQRPHLRGGAVVDLVDRHRRGRADLGRVLYLVAAFETHLRCREEDGCAS
ncbi:MAG: asparagine synthase (glutamine-hydrolyzing) [Planctomycetota bacterium]